MASVYVVVAAILSEAVAAAGKPEAAAGCSAQPIAHVIHTRVRVATVFAVTATDKVQGIVITGLRTRVAAAAAIESVATTQALLGSARALHGSVAPSPELVIGGLTCRAGFLTLRRVACVLLARGRGL